MKRRAVTLAMVLALCLSLLPVGTPAAGGNLSYMDETGELRTCTDYTEVTSMTNRWSSGTYVVTGEEVSVSEPVGLDGVVTLILCDGASLTVDSIYNASEKAEAVLAVYGQSDGTGLLNVRPLSEVPAICVDTLIVNGGRVIARSQSDEVAYAGIVGNVTVNGGAAAATGASPLQGAKNGGIGICGSVAVTGGSLTATGGSGSENCLGGDGISGPVTYTGGRLEATGGSGGYSAKEETFCAPGFAFGGSRSPVLCDGVYITADQTAPYTGEAAGLLNSFRHISLAPGLTITNVAMDGAPYCYGDSVGYGFETGDSPRAFEPGTSLEVTDRITDWTWSYEENTGTAEAPAWQPLSQTPWAAGSYRLVVTAAGDGCWGELTLPFSIEKRPVTLRPKDVSVKVNGEPPVLELDLSGLLAADRSAFESTPAILALPNGLIAAEAGKRVGLYPITWVNSDAIPESILANYAVTAETAGTLKVYGSGSGSGDAAYVIHVSGNGENGTLTVAPQRAAAGETVTITPVSEEGYALDSLIVSGGDGKPLPLTDNGDGTFCFAMPRGAVTVTGAFAPAGCSRDEACPIDRFADTANDAWWHDGIHYCLENGLMNGVSQTQFAPNGTTTRGMVATILYRIAGEPAFRNDNVFSDVEAGKWYEKPVVWANGMGIVKGCGADTFAPNDPVTREQLAVMLYRFAQYAEADTSIEDTNTLSYHDIFSVSDWAAEGVHYCVAAGILNGDNGNLNPQSGATRAQAAAMLQRFCENVLN